MADLERMGIWRLREIARQDSPEYDEAAARVFVRRLLEMAAEWLTDYRHANTGYQPFSSAAGMGEQPGGSTKAAEPLLTAYLAGEADRIHHRGALNCIEAAVRRSQIEAAFRKQSISQRQLIAVLIQARKLHPRQQGSEWTSSYDKIADNLGRYTQLLGFGTLDTVNVTRTVERPVVRETPRRHAMAHVPASQEERDALAARYAEDRPRIRQEQVVVAKPMFANGQAIKDAAKSAKASLILQAKAGVL